MREVIIVAMSKRTKRPISIGGAVALSVAVSVGAGLAYMLISLAFPHSPELLLIQLMSGNESAEITSSPLYQSLWSQVFTQQIFIQMPISMLAGGIVLGRKLGDEYGLRKLYIWAAACGIFNFIAPNLFLWIGKLVNQNMHLNPGDVTSQLLVANLFAFLLWVGLYILGADIGRRFRKSGTPRTATA